MGLLGPVVGIVDPLFAPWPIDPEPILDRSGSGGGHRSGRGSMGKTGPRPVGCGRISGLYLRGVKRLFSCSHVQADTVTRLSSFLRPAELPPVRGGFPWLFAFAAGDPGVLKSRGAGLYGPLREQAGAPLEASPSRCCAFPPLLPAGPVFSQSHFRGLRSRRALNKGRAFRISRLTHLEPRPPNRGAPLRFHLLILPCQPCLEPTLAPCWPAALDFP